MGSYFTRSERLASKVIFGIRCDGNGLDMASKLGYTQLHRVLLFLILGGNIQHWYGSWTETGLITWLRTALKAYVQRIEVTLKKEKEET